MLSGPNVTVSGNNVKVDWTRSFDLRSALEQYTLEENNIEAYTGNKLSVSRPNREVGGNSIVFENCYCIICRARSTSLHKN